jgi:hypothetical protein
MVGSAPVRVRRQRQRSRARWFRSIVRVLSVFVLAFFLEQSTLAYAVVASANCGQECPDDDRNCPCPLDCSWGCGASRVPGVPPMPVVPDLLILWSLELPEVFVERAPPAAPTGEILHVPRAPLAS